jgi:hypothetical protein
VTNARATSQFSQRKVETLSLVQNLQRGLDDRPGKIAVVIRMIVRVSAPDLDDAWRRRRTTRDPFGRIIETTEEDAMRTFGNVPIQTLDAGANFTSDALAKSRPGFRFADRSASETAYAAMCAELQDAWKPKDDKADALTPQLPPYGWPFWA